MAKHEFTFRVELLSIIKIEAESIEEARDAIDDVVETMALTENTIIGMNQRGAPVTILEADLEISPAYAPYLFEIDDEDVDNPSDEDLEPPHDPKETD